MGRWLLRIAAPVILILTVAPAAFADEAPPSGLITLDDIGTGSLLLRTDRPGRYVRAPLVSSRFDIQISGPVVRATLSQRFRNPSDGWVEGRYAFPLPDEAAVDSLRMRIGGRFIEGEIRERRQAREAYEQAKAEGRKAALVEQHRPNLFTNDVANIGPDETVVVQIAWLQTVAPRDGAFELRLPLVAAPRYSPRPVVRSVAFGPDGWALDDPVPDRDEIASPIVDPESLPEGAIHNPVAIAIDLSAGFPLATVESRHHPIRIDRPEASQARIELDGAVPADRDFVLRWTAATGASPSAALFRETHGGRDYYLAMLTPPDADEAAAPPPREVIFVQDVSGSMDGESIRQARRGLALALRRLGPDDRFNLIVFNDSHAMLSERPLAATEANVARAVAAVERLQAGGGTEMLPALSRALAGATGEAGRLRQIVFLTDGAVGDEARLLAEIERNLGDSRLFTVGIGSAPNGYFMTRAAEMGRGSAVFIDDLSEVAGQMADLFRKLEHPVLTGLSAALPDGAQDLSPSTPPDLYAGDPVVLAFHTPAGQEGEIRLAAGRNGEAFEWRMPLARAAERPGIAKLWARKRIRSLEALAHSQTGWEAGRDTIDARLLRTALDHGLVSRLTSLVAVDRTPSRPDGAPSDSAVVPLNLPAGWNPAVFLDATAAPASRRAAAVPASQLAMLKAGQSAEAAAAPPRGSLNWKGQAALGLILLLIGLGTLTGLSRRRGRAA